MEFIEIEYKEESILLNMDYIWKVRMNRSTHQLLIYLTGENEEIIRIEDKNESVRIWKQLADEQDPRQPEIPVLP